MGASLSELRALLTEHDNIVEKRLKKAKTLVGRTAKKMQNVSRSKVASNTGILKNDINIYTYGDLKAKVIVDNIEYGKVVEFGSGVFAGSHSIAPNGWWFYTDDEEKVNNYFKDKTMVIPKGSGYLVYTIGQPAQPYWYPSLIIIEQYWNKELEKIRTLES